MKTGGQAGSGRRGHGGCRVGRRFFHAIGSRSEVRHPSIFQRPYARMPPAEARAHRRHDAAGAVRVLRVTPGACMPCSPLTGMFFSTRFIACE